MARTLGVVAGVFLGIAQTVGAILFAGGLPTRPVLVRDEGALIEADVRALPHGAQAELLGRF